MSKQPQKLLNRLRELREARGLSQVQLAELVNTSFQEISKLERSERKLNVDWMAKLAAALGCQPAELIQRAVPLIGLEVVGEVQAGAWNEAERLPRDDWETIPVPALSAVYGDPYGLRVVGPSMNAVYPEGSILICVDFYDYPHDLKTGAHVIVRRRDKHDLLEITVKELRQDESGKLWLWPRSSDPRFQEPLPFPDPAPGDEYDDGRDNAVKVVAVVIASWIFRQPFDA